MLLPTYDTKVILPTAVALRVILEMLRVRSLIVLGQPKALKKKLATLMTV